MNNLKKKKKGFTLIELIIVLAVMAIIALIAIPNFISVKNNAKAKADLRSCETIERLALTVSADKDDITTGTYYWNGSKLTTNGTTDATGTVATELTSSLKGVKEPQVKEMKMYKIEFKNDGTVKVTAVASAS